MKGLGEVALQRRSGVKPEEIDAESPYIALEHMPKRCIALRQWSNADGLASGKFKFEQGDILFGKLRPYFHKVGVAPLDGVCSTDIVVVQPKSNLWFGFVLGHTSSAAVCRLYGCHVYRHKDAAHQLGRHGSLQGRTSKHSSVQSLHQTGRAMR